MDNLIIFALLFTWQFAAGYSHKDMEILTLSIIAGLASCSHLYALSEFLAVTIWFDVFFCTAAAIAGSLQGMMIAVFAASLSLSVCAYYQYYLTY